MVEAAAISGSGNIVGHCDPGRAPATAQGTIRAKVFTGISGTAVSALTGATKFPTPLTLSGTNLTSNSGPAEISTLRPLGP